MSEIKENYFAEFFAGIGLTRITALCRLCYAVGRFIIDAGRFLRQGRREAS
jgi:hypothetical protein